jgi:uncharacterized protein (TIGR02145 family)
MEYMIYQRDITKLKGMKKILLYTVIAAIASAFVFSCDGKSKNTYEPSHTTRAIGCTFTLTAPVLSENSTKQDVTWMSSDSSVATVENGIVTSLSSGKTVITAIVNGSRKKDVCILTVATGCNNHTPNFGTSLGTINFKTDQVWKVGTQEWSDAVISSSCRKTTYSGGSLGNQNADCRSNPEYGDLFSWCAVIRFQDQLCPDGWRVPHESDFARLDMELKHSGDGQISYVDTLMRDRYTEIWGSRYGGFCGMDGMLGGQGWSAYYWTQAERGTEHGFRMNYHSDGYAFPQGWFSKDNGFMLRCVR